MATSLDPVITADHMQLASFEENEPFLMDELILEIFSHLNLQELGNYSSIAKRFITKIDDLLLKKILKQMTTFGKEEWETFFGEVGEAPPLPRLNVLKEVYKTYMLVLLPETVDGEPLTLNLFKTLAETPKGGGHVTKINFEEDLDADYGDAANISSRWVLFSKSPLEGTRGKPYEQQTLLVAAKGAGYEIPCMLDAVVSIASRHVQSKERLFIDCYTRCQETINLELGDLYFTVGCFYPTSLKAYFRLNDTSESVGVAPVFRK